MARIAEMFHPRLGEQPNMKHLLIRHAGLMGGELIEHGIAGHSPLAEAGVPCRLAWCRSCERAASPGTVTRAVAHAELSRAD